MGTERKQISALSGLFGGMDIAFFVALLFVSGVVARLPIEIFNPDNPYPTLLYYIFTTVAQTLGILVGVGLFLIIYARKRSGNEAYLREVDYPGSRTGSLLDLQGMIKGTILMSVPLLLSFVVIPLTEQIYTRPELAKGIAIWFILMSIWGIGTTILAVVTPND